MEWSGWLNHLTGCSGKRKNCFLSWHHPSLLICLIVWPLENGAADTVVQYALHNFSREFVLFCEMAFYWLLRGMFGQIIIIMFSVCARACECVCVCVVKWPRDTVLGLWLQVLVDLCLPSLSVQSTISGFELPVKPNGCLFSLHTTRLTFFKVEGFSSFCCLMALQLYG